MNNLQDLIAQKEALELQIEEIRQQERAQIIKQVKEVIAWHNLTQDDIFGKKNSTKNIRASKGVKVAAKYRDPKTGLEWSGRGLAPKWLQGKDKTKFLIK